MGRLIFSDWTLSKTLYLYKLLVYIIPACLLVKMGHGRCVDQGQGRGVGQSATSTRLDLSLAPVARPVVVRSFLNHNSGVNISSE